MDAVIHWLQSCLADPLATARKASAPVGVVGFDFPLDIAASPARTFCHLPWQAGRRTPQADAWLESSFPGWARSILQDWSEGRFDLFAAVVFSRGDDAAQRLYYYVCELQRRGQLGGPRALILDVAAIPRASSVQHCVQALRTLLAELELDSDSLAAGIARANRQRALFARLAQTGAPGHLCENLARAALFCDPLPVLEEVQFPACTATARLYLAGSAPPDDCLHRVAEAQHWNIVGEMHARSLLRHGESLLAGADPLLAIAGRLNANPYGSRAFVDRTELLRAELARTDAAAVLFWLTREDEAQAWDLANQRAACTQAGKACLALPLARWDYADGALDTLALFLQNLETTTS